MKTKPAAGFRQGQRWVWSLLLTIMCGLGPSAFSQIEEQAEPRGSLAGERAIEELKREQTNEVYNVHYGRIGFQVGARLGAAYTDNVFLSGLNRLDDFILRPEVTLGASVPLTELNTLKLSLGVGYEWFAKNQSLNGDAPLVSPDSELMFTMFVKDFRIRLHDQFSYQQTLVFNDQPVNQTRIYNFTNVSRFDRLDNFVGPTVDWDLNKVILTLGYDHENFVSTTEQFKYLSRASEWFTGAATYLLGEQRKIGLEAKASDNNYDNETVLNNHWRARVGPFAEVKLPEGMLLRAGAGYDLARFDSQAAPGSDYDTWYGYATLRQELRWFTHSLSGGRETVIGDNANNLTINYARYSISSEVFKNVDVEGQLSADFSKEFGGSYFENYIQYVSALRAGYQFHKYWRADLGYEYFWNDSETPQRSFHRNRVSLDVTFRF